MISKVYLRTGLSSLGLSSVTIPSDSDLLLTRLDRSLFFTMAGSSPRRPDVEIVLVFFNSNDKKKLSMSSKMKTSATKSVTMSACQYVIKSAMWF